MSKFLDACRVLAETKRAARRKHFKGLSKPLGFGDAVKRIKLNLTTTHRTLTKGSSIGRKLAREDLGRRGSREGNMKATGLILRRK